MKFEVNSEGFVLDGRSVFLNSGEIHYFRIKRELWDKHLAAAEEAGLMAVSSYVPWAWHEAKEGVFDFDGSSCPERDLAGWLERCQAHGLKAIVKPGPFILAEFRGAGLPDWFLEQHGEECRMRDRAGRMVASEGVSLFREVYLEKVTAWYDRIMPFIAERQLSAGGPVMMMQVCNEIGLFTWLAKQADYCEVVRQKFIAFLSRKFGDVSELNAVWGTAYADFAEVALPPDVGDPYLGRTDRARDADWHRFWRGYYAEYLRMLAGMARDRGVDVPFYHNLPGWIYGGGCEFPVNITMYDELYGADSGIIFGVDHIPEYMSHRNMHDDRILNDIVLSMQAGKPVFAAEFQSGSREYQVVTSPREMELFYKASIANGLSGWNYYMFSQGRNPARKGYSGDTFYWFNPLTAEGEKTSAFPLVRKMSRMIAASGETILKSKRRAEVCVPFHPAYYATEVERPVGPECELEFVPSAIRRAAYYDGLLKVLQILNIDYDMVDLSKVDGKTLAAYGQVWAFCTDEMDGREQQVLVDYANDGGDLVIFPYLPDRDISQQPCTVLRDALEVIPAGSESIDSPLIDILDRTDIKCANPQIVFDEDSLGGAEVIARTLQGSACGFRKRLGNGRVLHIGTWLGFDTEGHLPVYEALLEGSGARLRQTRVDNGRLAVAQRFTDDGAGLLFVGNYYHEETSARVHYTHPETGESMPLPYRRESANWPALCGLLTPLGMELADGIKLLHSTSDVLRVEEKEGCLELTLEGDRDLPGEIVMEGAGTPEIQSLKLSGEPLSFGCDGDRVVAEYEHKHQAEMVLSIQVNPAPSA
jgi:beta-galactosidase